MTSKERVLRTIHHQEPDRPPIFATLTPQMARDLSEHLGMSYEPPIDSMLSTRISHTELLLALGNDCVGVAACSPKDSPTKTLEDGTMVNEWGMRVKNAGLYDEFCAYPLSHAQTKKDIEEYPFPDPHAEGRFDLAKAMIEKYGQDYAIVADLETSFFETSWYLVGMEKFLMDLVLETEYVPTLLDTVMHINLEMGRQLIELGADIIWAGDDFGTQQGMLFNPAIWRKHFKPRIQYMFQEFRKVNPEIKIAWHSCGSILPIIPDFIEIGLDILNPIQPLAKGMDPVFLKKEYGKDLVFFGGIDVQQLLPFSTPEEIKKEVKRIIDILGKGGGFIAAPAHNIQPNTPVENVIAFFDAVKQYSA